MLCNARVAVKMVRARWCRFIPWLLVALPACSSRSALHAQLEDDGSSGASGGSAGSGGSVGSGGSGGTATGGAGTGGSGGSGGATGGSGGTGGGVCGDGERDPGEECDAGGDSRRCDGDCTRATCGDDYVNPQAGEECDDGGESEACDSDCTFAECGDGVLNQEANEQCDDGRESRDCNTDCTRAACGDGIVNASAGEECDDEEQTASCDGDCTRAECGDGLVNAQAGEECDDGGESDACDADCTEVRCGDGVVNGSAGEQCDDDTDGCSDCRLFGNHPFYSEDFPNGALANSSNQCSHWDDFRGQLAGNFAAIEVSGSNVEVGVRCEDRSLATRLCNALAEGTSLSVACGNDTWTVGTCGGAALTVNAPICQCDAADSGAYVVRPCINNENWGGANSATCGAPAQRLEVRCLTDSTSVYEHDFPQGTVPTTDEQCVDYTEYTQGLTGRYFSVTLSGSNDENGITCNDAALATELCNALSTRVPVDTMCNGVSWHVGECSTIDGEPFEISAGTNSACTCSGDGHTLRPCIGNDNWGGANGPSCGSPAQTLRLECNSQPSYYSAQFPEAIVPSSGAQCTSWETFRASLTNSAYTRVTLRGSANPGGVSCSDPDVATRVCQALSSGDSVSGLACGGNEWNVGTCGGVAVSVNSGVCSCTTGGAHIVRPCVDSADWGGLGTETCAGEAQSMDVICE